ncbi:MAG: hypothetical protein LBV15_06445 [Planctomycetota bacterium]|jgi:hypothetical protein|nr:hypothetical protein [Planctomycetota bacterium]
MSGGEGMRRLDPELYRHPDERRARERLEKIPGFAKGMARLTEIGGGQAESRAEIASMIRIGPGVYPRLHDIWRAALARFGLEYSPLQVAPGLAEPWTLRGRDRPALILDQSLLEGLSETAMAAFLALRAGSIRLGHVPYLSAADLLRRLWDFSGLAAVPVAMLAWGLESWRHAALFSADRAAALSLGGPEAVADLLARLAGAGGSGWGGVTDPEALRLQGIEALSLENDWANSRWRRFAMAMNRQNHAALIRRLDLLSWFAGGAPACILAGGIPEPETGGAAEREEPGPALWGAFAGSPEDDCQGFDGQILPELTEAMEKGWSAMRQAGEAIWHSLDRAAEPSKRRFRPGDAGDKPA